MQLLPTACFCNGAVTSWFKVLSSFNAFVSWDRTRLRKGTTAETQTLAASPKLSLQMGLSEKIRETFEITVDKSSGQIMKTLDNKIKSYYPADILQTDSVDYSEFKVKQNSIEVIRMPGFFTPFRQHGKILIKVDEERGRLLFEIYPYNKILLIILTFGVSFLVLWSISWLTYYQSTNSIFTLLGVWTLFGLIFFVMYKINMRTLKNYAKQISRDLVDDRASR